MAKSGRLILIYGTEDYLKQEKRQELLQELHTEGSMNFNAFTGRDTDFDEVVRLSVTLPFLEPVRTILLEDSGQLQGTPSEALLQAAEELPETTTLLFYEQAADPKNKLYQLIKARGEIFRFVRTEEKSWKEAQADRSSIRRWAVDYLKAADRKADGRIVEELMALAGTDRMNLKSELDKLIAYTYGRPASEPIRREDLAAICSRTLTDRVFDMLAAKLSGNVPKALSLYEDLRALRVPPMKVLFLLERQFQQVYALRDLAGQGLSDAQAADRLQLKDWQFRKLREQSQRLSLKDARAYLELAASLEMKVKSGDLQDRLAVEVLLCC